MAYTAHISLALHLEGLSEIRLADLIEPAFPLKITGISNGKYVLRSLDRTMAFLLTRPLQLDGIDYEAVGQMLGFTVNTEIHYGGSEWGDRLTNLMSGLSQHLVESNIAHFVSGRFSKYNRRIFSGSNPRTGFKINTGDFRTDLKYLFQ
ncbi:MAG TPA: hypothetical protein VJI98_02980 [Candidatus Nanoarchaeia archaeon]|nr:hypothetical protein [Candidatus Nanoarchaeia archaeon]